VAVAGRARVQLRALANLPETAERTGEIAGERLAEHGARRRTVAPGTVTDGVERF
jgi:hypothetical protein